MTLTGLGANAQNSNGGGGIVDSVVAGTHVTVDNTDPRNPVVSSSGGGGGVVNWSAVSAAATPNVLANTLGTPVTLVPSGGNTFLQAPFGPSYEINVTGGTGLETITYQLDVVYSDTSTFTLVAIGGVQVPGNSGTGLESTPAFPPDPTGHFPDGLTISHLSLAVQSDTAASGASLVLSINGYQGS